MSKTDNLTDFLTDVADAIREKKGTTEKINPQNFSEEIRGIESGGGGPTWNTPEEKDVNFFDYDGTLLYSYTWDEAVALTEFPTPPNLHKGLVFEGWNYTTDDMLAQQGRCWIGALYNTENGRTRFSFDTANAIIPLYSNTVAEIDVHWGDGCTERVSVSGKTICAHTYVDAGIHVAEIDVLSSVVSLCNGGMTTECIEINIGENVNIDNQGVCSFPCIKRLSLNNRIKYIGTNILNVNTMISALVLPNLVEYLGTTRVAYEFNTIGIYIPPRAVKYTIFADRLYKKSRGFIHDMSTIVSPIANTGGVQVDSVMSPAFSPHNHTIVVDNVVVYIDSNGVIPNEATSIGNYAGDARLLHDDVVVIPDNIKEMGTASLRFAKGVNVKLPATLDSLYGNTIPNNSIIDARSCVQVPVVKSAINVVFYAVVPDALYGQWVNATNWSSISPRIYKESELPINVRKDVDWSERNVPVNEGYITVKNVGEVQTYDVLYSGLFRHAIFDVEEYDVAKISGEGGASPRLYALIDNDGIIKYVAPSGFNINGIMIDLSGIKTLLFNTNYNTPEYAKEIILGKYRN